MVINSKKNSFSTDKSREEYHSYLLPVPNALGSSLEKFIDRFHTTYEILVEQLLLNHFYVLRNEIKAGDYELITYYYYSIDDIFRPSEDKACKSSKEREKETIHISVKLNCRFHKIVQEISKELHYTPEAFITKAIRYQWNLIEGDIEAGYYDFIEMFCDISKMRKVLAKLS